MRTDSQGRSHISNNRLIAYAIVTGIVLIAALSMVTASGTPDPTEAVNPSMTTSIVNSAVIVFREGLEAVLIFAAVTASFLGAKRKYRKPVMQGVAWAFVATVATWFFMQAVLGVFSAYGDVLLAVTGLMAIAVLLLVMNWFFHKVYWTDHISGLNKKKRDLVEESEQSGAQMRRWSFVALGFTSVYREGFEVVLFLQSLQLKSGTAAVMWGVFFGLLGTVVVGWLTFVAHHKLPYKRMLVLTGVLLGAVLVIMTGGSARTMQDLGWISTTQIGVAFPDWWARWFEVVPTVETLALQLVAGTFVVGSYYAAEWWAHEKRRRISVHAPAPASGQSTPGSPVALANSTAPAIATASARAMTPAQVRGAAYAADPARIPRALCGAPAVTFCGAPAETPKALLALSSRGPSCPPARQHSIAPALLTAHTIASPQLGLPRWEVPGAPISPTSPPVPKSHIQQPAAAPSQPAPSAPAFSLNLPRLTLTQQQFGGS